MFFSDNCWTYNNNQEPTAPCRYCQTQYCQNQAAISTNWVSESLLLRGSMCLGWNPKMKRNFSFAWVIGTWARLQFCCTPKIVRCLMPPYYPHFVAPFSLLPGAIHPLPWCATVSDPLFFWWGQTPLKVNFWQLLEQNFYKQDASHVTEQTSPDTYAVNG